MPQIVRNRCFQLFLNADFYVCVHLSLVSQDALMCFSSFKVIYVNIFIMDSSPVPGYGTLEKYSQNLDLPHPARKPYIQIV